MLKLNIEDVKPTLVETGFPKVVIFESSTYCNLTCIMCPQGRIKRKNKFMEFKLFQKAVDEICAENCKAEIWFAIMGEPLVNVELLLKMIHYAKSVGLHNLNLNTNGCLLTKPISEALINSGISAVTIGVDATDAETYEKIRCGGDYKKTVSAIEELLEINNSISPHPVRIILQFIVMDENEGQQDTFKSYWLSKGATIKIRPKLGWGTAVKSNQLYLNKKERNFPCPWIIRTMSIHVDGSVAQCDADWDDKFNLSNIADKSIKEIWNNELKLIRQHHWNLDFTSEPCCDCKDWQAGRSYIYDPENME